jgi:hypothetical protein
LYHYKHETFYSFQTPINLFETTLKDEKQQSKQAPFLHHYKHETFYSFPTPINLFETTLKDEKQQIPEV